MQIIRMLIKGNQIKAEQELARRKIQYKEIWQRLAADTNSCVAKTPYKGDELLEKVSIWMREQPDMIPGYGYPDGTLLWYTIDNVREEWQ